MAASLEDILISVWRQALVEEAKSVTLDGQSFPVRRTSRSGLREDHRLIVIETAHRIFSRGEESGRCSFNR